MKKYLCLLVLSLLVTWSFAGSFEALATRDGVKLPFLYEKPEQAKAVVVLFQGGGGSIGVSGSKDKGWIQRDKAFLSGGATRFSKNGLVVAVVDTPSDRSDLNDGFRNSVEHNLDIKKLVKFLNSDNPSLPVWLIGTSNGSLTAAGAAIAMTETPVAGIVLTSTVTVEHSWSMGQKLVHPIYRADLKKVTLPVLIVHHKNDRCTHSLYQPIDALTKAFPNSKKVDLISVEGGSDNSNPCNGGYHQFLGQEQEVTDMISQWILAN
jgi:alpha-beta hydrolase superfamily lysophospholipase